MTESNYEVPEMVTLQVAAERTGLSYDCLRKLCINHKIVHMRAGRKYLVNMGKLIEFMNGEEVKRNA